MRLARLQERNRIYPVWVNPTKVVLVTSSGTHAVVRMDDGTELHLKDLQEHAVLEINQALDESFWDGMKDEDR